MLILPSWFTSSVSRLARAASVGRVLAATAAAFFAASASAQSIQLTSTAYTVNENGGSLRVAVRRVGVIDSTATVRIAATAGTAIDGQDFVARTATRVLHPRG